MWYKWMSFEGKLDREALNTAYAREIGEDGAAFVTDDKEYQEAVKEGWIVFEDGKTNIYIEVYYNV